MGNQRQRQTVDPALIHSGVSLAGILLLALAAGACTPRTSEQIRLDALADVQRLDLDSAQTRLNGLYRSNRDGEPNKIDGSPRPAAFNKRHGLLWRMQRGILDHLRGDLAASQAHFHDAGSLVDYHRSQSLAQIAGSMVTNENIQDYAGFGFEHIQVAYYRALNAVLQAQESEGLFLAPALVAAPPPPPPPPPTAGAEQAEETPEIGLPAREPAQVNILEAYDQAINFGRRMVLDQLAIAFDTKAEGWATTYRFADDPFARIFLAALIFASPSHAADDWQLAHLMMRTAREGYKKHRGLLGNDRHFRYEVGGGIDIVDRLAARAHRRGDPRGYREHLRSLSDKARQRYEALELPEGHGSILVVNHVGLITRPQVLDIRFRTGVAVLAGIFSLSETDKARGITVNQITLGPLQVAAKGPGSDIINTWIGMPFAPALMEQMKYLTTVIGFAMPVHRKDAPIPPRASVRLDDQAPRPLAVVSDIDAYARATLKDRQPRIFLTTVMRTAAKQAAVALAAREVEKSEGAGWGWLARWAGSQATTWSEIADVRAWFLLPDHIQATLLDVPAGKHRLQLDAPFGAVDLGSVRVPEGRLVIVPVRTLPPKQFY